MKTNKPEKTKIRKREFEIKLLSENAILPKKAVRGAIGYDLCIPNDFRVPAHSRVAIPLDIAINLPFGIEGKIEPRSGCCLNGMEGYGKRKVVKKKIFGLFPITEIKSCRMFFDADVCISKIDPNHPETIHVIIVNRDESFLIRKGSRIAQLSFYQTIAPFFKQVDKLTCASRGGSLGHTGLDRLRTDRNASETKDSGTNPETPDCRSNNDIASATDNADNVSSPGVQSVQPPFPVDITGLEIDQDPADIGVHI